MKMELNNCVIMGAIYDPDTDCQIVLMKVTAKDWDKYQEVKFQKEVK